ncbi:MAG: GxxExxY protein [Desulfuromonadaceae bacterium]
MGANRSELILTEEVYAIVGAAIEVSNGLGAGFLEAVYQEALELEFSERNLPFVAQQRVPIAYKGRMLKKVYIPDFLCFEQIIVEIKAIKNITGDEQAQLLNYLKASGKPVGVLPNFGSPKLEWKRMVFNHSNY